MFKLDFDKQKCINCKTTSCLSKCQYMDLDTEKAKIEWEKLINDEKSSVLEDCVTCYACEEFCPVGNHPFYFIVEQQEKNGLLPLPVEKFFHYDRKEAFQ